MCLENTSPKTPKDFAGQCFWGAHTINCEEIITFLGGLLQAISKHIQEKPFKNYCEHSSKNPKSFQPPANNKPRPDINENGKGRLCDWYYDQDEYLPNLTTSENQNRKDRINPNSKMHSQRREAIKLVGEVLLHYFDLVSFRIGWYDRTGAVFRPLSVTEIAKKAKIEITRAKRALSDLAHSGYLKMQRRYDRNKKGDYIGLVSIRKLTRKFFLHLGFSNVMLELRRHWKLKRLAKAGATNNPFNPLAQRALKKFESYRKRKSHTSKSTAVIDLSPEDMMVVNIEENTLLLKKLKEDNPDLSLVDYVNFCQSINKNGP